MQACIFCQIASKKIPAKAVYEDENCIAFLDIAPRSKGMTIVASRQHYKEFDENFELSSKIFQSALIVSEMVKQALQPKSVSLSIISSEAVPHFHIRIYPVYEKEIPLIENQPIEMDERTLDDIAGKIRSVRVERKEEKKEEVKEEVEEEKPSELSDEDAYWIKRDMEMG